MPCLTILIIARHGGTDNFPRRCFRLTIIAQRYTLSCRNNKQVKAEREKNRSGCLQRGRVGASACRRLRGPFFAVLSAEEAERKGALSLWSGAAMRNLGGTAEHSFRPMVGGGIFILTRNGRLFMEWTG